MVNAIIYSIKEERTKVILMKKLLALAMAVCIVSAGAISGSLAYNIPDPQASAIAESGTLDIEQVVQQRGADGTIINFEQNKMLLPVVYHGDMIPTPDTKLTINGTDVMLYRPTVYNVRDQFVSVHNLGTLDAFVRVVVAVPLSMDHVTLNKNETDFQWNDGPKVEIDGVNYDVIIGTYRGTNSDGILKAGMTTPPSLLQIALNRDVTSEIAAAFGSQYKVYVVSQAMEAVDNEDAVLKLNEAFQISADTFRKP